MGWSWWRWAAAWGIPITIFHEEEDFHEDWELPDPELVFMRASKADHQVIVSRDMLPHA